jgi:rod shape-determining protein MreC
VSATADIIVGDVVVTSGIDGIYPKGFVIGQIESIERVGGGFGAIVIKPSVAFASLESLLVVLAPDPPVAEATAAEQSSAETQARE